MCGIVGYLGKGEAYPALIKGLKRLEYRGYDSAGVALISNDGALNVYKAKTARNISKNITLTIPAHDYPNFKPAKSFVDLMLGQAVENED